MIINQYALQEENFQQVIQNLWAMDKITNCNLSKQSSGFSENLCNFLQKHNQYIRKGK
ncbi:hypothetical protein pb186bvf_005102 [Paramecium bursaria]